MDIVAHGLWVGIGLVAAGRRRGTAPRTVALTIGMAVLPDVAQLLPLFAAAAVDPARMSLLVAYATALPDSEPALPSLVALLTHHLHCIMHSAVVAGVVTGVVWLFCRTLWLPLLGWWSHIAIDVFTHSEDFYPVPVLYPFTQRGFDGLAWNTPWFLALNYVAIAAAVGWLVVTRTKGTKP